MARLDRVHHVGLPVTSLERSVPWYVNVLGILDTGIRSGGSGEGHEKALQVKKGSSLTAAFLRVGEHMVLELLEYQDADSRPFELRNSDIGALHVGFQVDDIWQSYEALVEAGVQFNTEPVLLDEAAGPLAGYGFVYFRDPDGIQLELLQVPSGKPY